MSRRVCRRCGKNRAERFYRTPRGRICITCQRTRKNKGTRAQRVYDTYNITLEEYDLLLAHQGGGCAICEGTRRTNLDVDHDHKVERETGNTRGSVRGLLCRRCNRRLLPACQDNPEILRRAIAYLESPPAKRVIR